LPDSDARARQELWLQITLGVPLIATEGYAAPDVGRVYRQARALCERLETTPEISQVLWGLWTFHALKAELATALGIALEFLKLSERVVDTGVAMRGHWAMEITCTHQGNFTLALEHFHEAISLYDPADNRDAPFIDALNPGVALRCFAGWSLWFIGQPDRALSRIEEAVALARTLSEPHGLAHALGFAAILHQLRGERPLALKHAAAAGALSRKHGLGLYHAMARIVQGWALVGRGNDEHAAEQIQQGLTAWQSTGAQLMLPHFLALLADAWPAASSSDRGISLLDEALALAESTGERCYQAELYRLKGERLLVREESAGTEARACLEQSLTIARGQEALSLELRTAMSLARLERHRSGKVGARDLVKSVYERFKEGFDTLDLREARHLLDAER
jgi:predicted ATPase